MAGPVGRPAQFQVTPPFEDAIEDGFGEIGIVQHASPRPERLVGGEDHWAVMQVAVIDDLKEDVGGVGPIAEVADLVDDEHVGMRVAGQDLAEPALERRRRELVDQRRRRGEAGLEAVLDGAIGDGDGQMGLAGPAGAAEDQRLPLRDELGTEGAAEQGEADTGLQGEVVLVDRLEKGEVGAADAPLNARLGAMRDLLGHEQGEKVAIAHPFLLGALGQIGIEAPYRRQVQSPQECIDIDRGRRRRHPTTSAMPVGGIPT